MRGLRSGPHGSTSVTARVGPDLTKPKRVITVMLCAWERAWVTDTYMYSAETAAHACDSAVQSHLSYL